MKIINDTVVTPSDTSSEGRDWLVPSEALNRYVPPSVEHIGSELEKKADVRYGYRIGGMNFLIGEGVVSEVIESPCVYPVPKSSRYFVGILNQRGNIVPVFDLSFIDASHENNSDDLHNKTIAIVLGKGIDAVGMIINELPETVVKDDQLSTEEHIKEGSSLIHKTFDGFIQFAFVNEGADWFDFDYSEFLKYMANRKEECLSV